MNTIEEISEFLNPEKSVLVLWDIQKMLVDSIFNKDEFLKNVKLIAPAARANGIPVVSTKITPLPDRFQSAGRKFMMKKRAGWGTQPPEAYNFALTPEPSDIILNKNTASIFVGTNFELMMRNAGISTLVFTGIATEMGVESSVREATNRGFFPVIVTDAVSSSNKEGHTRSLENLKTMMPLVSTDELVAFWKK